MDATLTCKLTTPELRRRKSTVIAELKMLVTERTESEDGFTYRFDGSDETIDRIVEFVKTERLCCDFFTFALTVETSSAVLKITGPDGAKQFLAQEVGL